MDVQEAILLEQMQYQDRFNEVFNLSPLCYPCLCNCYADILPECFYDFAEPGGEVVRKFNYRKLSSDEIFRRIAAVPQRERKGRVRKGVKYE